jgi:hypothetical protein
MNRALAFVLIRSVRGRLLQMLRRLKDPRYLFGFVVGAGWILFWLSRMLIGSDFNVERFRVGLPPEAVAAIAGPLGQTLQVLIAVVLAVFGILWWALPFGRNSLEFTEPELHLLLPSPIKRRTLIQYGVLKSQPGILVGVAITSFFMRPGSLLGSLGTILALWIVFTLWDLHAKGRGLWYARLDELSRRAAWSRQITLWVVLLGMLVGVAWGGFQIGLEMLREPVLNFEEFDGDVILEAAPVFANIAWTSPLAWALSPLIWLTTPVFSGLAGDVGLGWLLTLAFPAVLLLLHNEWVVRSQSRFEETALNQAKKRSADAIEGMNFWRRTRARRNWETFPLRAVGRPELALIWKNLMMVQRIPLTVAFAVPTGLLAFTVLLVAAGLLPAWFVFVLQIAGLAIMLIPPLFNARASRNDFRSDLLRLEIMRTIPIGGVRMFWAQVAAPVLTVMLQISFGIMMFFAVDSLIEFGWVAGDTAVKQTVADHLNVHRFALLPLIVLGYLPVALAVTLLTATLENIAALAFPGWVQLGKDKKQAASKFGQHMLVFMALSIVMFAGLLPGVLTVAAILAVQVLFWNIPLSAWELPLLGLAGAIPIGAVVVALAAMGGNLWDRLDPSAELLAGRN